MNLKAKDIWVEEGRAYYSYVGKGAKHGRRELAWPALVSIRRTLADCAKNLDTMRPEESLWQAGAATPGVSQSVVYGRFRRYLQAAGLPPSGLHVLRHSAAKLRRDAGETVESVSHFLDHSSLAVTTIYLRRLEVVEDAIWSRVAEAIGVKLSTIDAPSVELSSFR